MYPLLISLITAFPFACACMFSIIDLKAVLDTATDLPLIEIYYQGTGSKAAASVLMALFAFCFFGCLVGNGKSNSREQTPKPYTDLKLTATTSSRTLWAVSRDDAFPFSHLWMRVSRTFRMPANAMCLSATCISVSTLVFLQILYTF